MMFINPQINNKDIHQLIHFTRMDRYPEIFDVCSKIKNDAINVLSFGCSSGEECQTLRKFYPKASIYGVDISDEILDVARASNQDSKILFSNSVPDISFDFVFCMSVFCRHPETAEIDDCSRHYRFSLFEEQLGELISKLTPDGVIIVYNSNFRFSDTKYAPEFKAIPTNDEHKSGFVIKFDKSHRRVSEPYLDCVFKKLV